MNNQKDNEGEGVEFNTTPFDSSQINEEINEEAAAAELGDDISTLQDDLYDDDDDDETEGVEDKEFLSHGSSFDLTLLELGIINKFLYDTLNNGLSGLTVHNYGMTDRIGVISYGGVFNITKGWWFRVTLDGYEENEFIFQTSSYLDRYEQWVSTLSIASLKEMETEDVTNMYKKFKELAFNNSVYKGKCLEVSIIDGNFKDIKILDLGSEIDVLILTDTQKKFIDHFISRVKRGKNVRYLFNGVPGSGKTESIRNIAKSLIPEVTFIIPKFSRVSDLTMILESCEIFNSGVILMDDIDLYLGSRDNGSYTNLLGEFLSFFDGVKKRKISLLASTNDKSLVDKAAERPGRFNFTLDYGYLTDEQIIEVCKIHLDDKWKIQEVYDKLTGKLDGSSLKLTGAFIANLAENIREMELDEDATEDGSWKLEDTLDLITACYKGFYSSQIKSDTRIGFRKDA